MFTNPAYFWEVCTRSDENKGREEGAQLGVLAHQPAQGGEGGDEELLVLLPHGPGGGERPGLQGVEACHCCPETIWGELKKWISLLLGLDYYVCHKTCLYISIV